MSNIILKEDINTPLNIILNDFILIKSNKFIKHKEDSESLSYLIDIPLTQSEKIQFGSRMENIISQFIIKNSKLKNIKEKTIKGKKETDHLFMDENKKIIYYAELKSNLNLDTEKSNETIKKCLKIETELKEKYIDYKIKMFLVSIRHLNKDTINNGIKSKYKTINDNLVGLNEYILQLGIEQQKEFKNEKKYKQFLNNVVLMLKN